MTPVPPRKFATEFAIHMGGLGVVLLTRETFSWLAHPDAAARLAENPCHIYMVMSRPSVLFDADAFAVEDDTISGRFLLQEGMSLTTFPFALENSLGTTGLRFECPYHPSESTDSNGALAECVQNLNSPFPLQQNVGHELCTPHVRSLLSVLRTFWKARDWHRLILPAIALAHEGHCAVKDREADVTY